MKTVVSSTGIDVLYPCTIHLLHDGEMIECDYKSDQTGRDLLNFICDYLSLPEKDFWGLKFVDTFEQRHWLDLNKLIKPQIKNVCPIHFYFRVKVYPPEPQRITDPQTKYQIFMQLRYDLSSGRLCCGPNDASLLLSLILQYNYGDFNPTIHFGNYIKEKIIYNQCFNTEIKAIDIHKHHLKELSKVQIEDLFLRMTSELETYGVDPYLIEDENKLKLNLWVNYKGMVTYIDTKKIHHLEWLAINKIKQDDTKLIVQLSSGDNVTFTCLTKAECNYIYLGAIDNFQYFTTSGSKSTIGTIGSDTDEEPLDENMLVEDKFEDYLDDSVYEPVFDSILETRDCKCEDVSFISWFFNHYHIWHVALLVVFLGALLELYFIVDHDILGHILIKKHLSSLLKKHVINKLFT